MRIDEKGNVQIDMVKVCMVVMSLNDRLDGNGVLPVVTRQGNES